MHLTHGVISGLTPWSSCSQCTQLSPLLCYGLLREPLAVSGGWRRDGWGDTHMMPSGQAAAMRWLPGHPIHRLSQEPGKHPCAVGGGCTDSHQQGAGHKALLLHCRQLPASPCPQMMDHPQPLQTNTLGTPQLLIPAAALSQEQAGNCPSVSGVH